MKHLKQKDIEGLRMQVDSFFDQAVEASRLRLRAVPKRCIRDVSNLLRNFVAKNISVKKGKR